MDVFSNLMVVGECLLDERRTKAFARAIKKIVQPTDIVLDVGTGSSILAMLSARAGAKQVYAIDIAPDIVSFAKKNVRNNELEKKITVIHKDAKDFSLPKPVDVVTMELMDTWLVAEQQAAVMNTLHRNGTITEKTKLIPYRYWCVATLAEYDFSFYGFQMPFVIQARNFGVRQKIQKKLTERIVVKDIQFSQPVDTAVNERVSVQIQKTGICNAVILESRTFLAPGISVWGTTDMNMPVIIPLPETKVKRGETKTLHITYIMAEGYTSFDAKLR